MQYVKTFVPPRVKDELVNRGLAGLNTEIDKIARTINERDIIAKKPWVDVRAYGVKGDGLVTSAGANDLAIKAAVDSVASTGGHVIFPEEDYIISDEIAGASNVKFVGEKKEVFITQNTAGKRVFNFNGKNDFGLENLKLIGKGAKDGYEANEHLLTVYNCSKALIESCHFYECRGVASVDISESDDVRVFRSVVDKFTYAAIQVLGDCNRVWVKYNYVNDCKADTQHSGVGYGIILSAGTAGDGQLYPNDVWIIENEVEDIPSWEGIDAHGGRNIDIVRNIVRNCSYGVALQITIFNADSKLENVLLDGNKVFGATSDVGASMASGGIFVWGDSTRNSKNIEVVNNLVKDTCVYKATKRGGYDFGYTENLLVANNRSIDNAYYGMNFGGHVQKFLVSNNFCLNNKDYAMYLGYGSFLQDGLIEGNHLIDDGNGTYSQLYGLGSGVAGYLNVEERNNFIRCATRKYGNNTETPFIQEFFSTKPNRGVWNVGDGIKLDSNISEGKARGYVCINRQDTQVRVAVSSTDSTIEVDSTSGMLAGDLIGIRMDDTSGRCHWSIIASITDADTLVIDDVVYAGGSAAIDNAIYTNRFEKFGIIDLQGSATWNPGSIADGDEEAKEVTVTGAALGDFAIASFSLDVADLVLNAQVTGANTVTCILANNTGGAIDLGEGTIYVKVVKK